MLISHEHKLTDPCVLMTCSPDPVGAAILSFGEWSPLTSHLLVFLLVMFNETISRELAPGMVRSVGIALTAAAMKAPVSPLAAASEIGCRNDAHEPARLSRLGIVRLLGPAVVRAAKETHSPPIEKHYPILRQFRGCGISPGEASDMGRGFKNLSGKTSPRACLPG
jgi:hypothetical protein